MKLVVGLGNPGAPYAGTRHNVGWLVLDRLAERAGWTGRGRQRDASNVVQGRYRGLDIAAGQAAHLHERFRHRGPQAAGPRARAISSTTCSWSLDDFALPFGKLRFREGGSHGGHNGLRSIIDELGNEQFARLRVGIGDPVRNARDHVLSTFAPDEQQRLDELLDAAADGVEAWARDGTSKAANRFNTFQLRAADADRLAAPGEVDGPPGDDGIRRTRPAGARSARTMATMADTSRPPLRGKRGRDRRIAEQVATDFAARHAPPKDDDAIDFDVAEVDAEVEDARRAEARGRGCRSAAAAPRPPSGLGRRPKARRQDRDEDRRRTSAARPFGAAPVARGDRHVHGPPRAAGESPGTSGRVGPPRRARRPSRTGRRPTSPRRSPRR